MKILADIEGSAISFDGTTVRYTARARIDDDGAGAAHDDPDHQGQTSLRFRGASLNADVVPYIVVPPQVITGVSQIVLGSQAWVTYRGRRLPAVVGDVGPHSRLGEISIALARDLGINPNANTGGVDTPSVDYEIEVGMPAQVNGITYDLQPS